MNQTRYTIKKQPSNISRKISRIGVFATGCAVFLYPIFLYTAVSSASSVADLKKSVSILKEEIASNEKSYSTVARDITLDGAYALGFVDAGQVTYINPEKLGTVSLYGGI